MGDRIAFFEGVRLGDFLKTHEELNLAGDDPAFAPAIFSQAQVAQHSHHGGVKTEVNLVAHFLRGHFSDAETTGEFMRRKLAFLANLKAVRDEPGALIVCGDDVTDSASVIADTVQGASVNIPISREVDSVAGETWVILRSDLSAEFVEIDADNFGDSITVVTLASDVYTDDVVVKPEYFFRVARMHGGVRIPGNQPGAVNLAADIALAFSTVADVEYSS